MYEDFKTLPHAGIRSLNPYVPGKSIEEVAKEQGLTDVIKLASNENAWGCSPAVLEALSDMISQNISLYPQSSQHSFRHQLAAHLEVESNMLTLGNGSDMLIGLLLNCFALHLPKHIITHRYAFAVYTIQAQTLGIPVVITPTHNWVVDIDAIIKTCNQDTALIFIANPNNPTGLLIEHTEIERLLENIPSTTLLVLDEAYHEYANPHDHRTIQWLKKYKNLVILRTFSKAYGLAGLRLGYAIAHPEITKILNQVQLPFMVNIAALTAGKAALKDQAFLQKTLRLTHEGLQFLKHSFDAMGVDYLPSHGNFLTIHRKDAMSLFLRFQEYGIVLRPLDAYGMNEYLRITVGTESQNRRLIEVCQHLFGE